ncbi:MAG: BtpA/SgcQ family protein [Phycisphaerales bacterium]|nr:BtpA/SgcQ family protein [Phycisphaerales bacterium]
MELRKSLIGMIHVGAMPGTPRAELPVAQLADVAAEEAKILSASGFDGIIIENMHDRPYVHGVQDPAVVAAMAVVVSRVRETTDLPLGVQVLSGGNREALAIAQAAGAGFVRCENFVYAHVADEGLLDRAEAGPLLRYRRAIGAEDVRVFCDIQKKHASHALTADLSLADLAHAAEFFGADGLIVTGGFTGRPARVEDLREVKGASSLPVLVGSGVTPENAGAMLEHADAVIVGSWIKRDGLWSNGVDPERCERMASAVEAARR